MAPRSHIWAMHDERNGEAVVAAAVAERIPDGTVAAAAAAAAVDEYMLLLLLLMNILLLERLLPHLPIDV